MNKTRLISLGAAVAALATVFTGTASASGPITIQAYECSTGRLCTWDRADGTGSPRMSFEYGARDLAETNGYNDKISSVFNNTGRIMCIYVDSLGRGSALPIAPGWKGALSPRYAYMDNKTSSIGSYDYTKKKCDGDVPGA